MKASKPKIPMPPPPPASVPRDIRARRRENQSLTDIKNVKNMMDYVKATEDHLDEIEKRLSHFIKREDLGELRELKEELREDLKAVKDKMEKLEEGPIVPPLASASKEVMNRILDKVRGLENGAQKLREEMEKDRREALDARAQVTEFFDKVKNTEKEIYRRMEKLRDMIGEAAEKGKEQEERVDADLKSMRRDSEQVRTITEVIEKMDMDKILREIESIKTKIGWLERGIEKIDIKPLYERIQEIDHALKILRASSPYVIE